jgi:hypothetical protein
MALESIQPLAEMIPEILIGDKARPTRKDHNLIAICEPIF